MMSLGKHILTLSSFIEVLASRMKLKLKRKLKYALMRNWLLIETRSHHVAPIFSLSLCMTTVTNKKRDMRMMLGD